MSLPLSPPIPCPHPLATMGATMKANKHSISFLLNEADAGAPPRSTPSCTVDGCAPTARKPSPDSLPDWRGCSSSSVASEAGHEEPRRAPLSPSPLVSLASVADQAPWCGPLRQGCLWLPIVPPPMPGMAVAGDVASFAPLPPLSAWGATGGGSVSGSPTAAASHAEGTASTTSSSSCAGADNGSDSYVSGMRGRGASATPSVASADAMAAVAIAPAVVQVGAATTAADASAGPTAAPRGGPHPCSSCNVSFRRLGDLRKHLSCVHAFPRRHACEYCGRRFGERSNMIKHVAALHLKRRDAVCGQCGKAFAFSDGLARHVRLVHGGERRYGCCLCGGRFKQRTHLQKHMAGVHKVTRGAKV
eukprot:TRINITY_DN2159_c0_g1_i1.p2 TRINITY_DN2159_c0_g1~~TRINITY_DN2159_c0_g1_i1.p2  ORF type:complete len:361 (-),score=59.37 TRINITY_DN2159_c0_g1_i1:153-1235(-)